MTDNTIVSVVKSGLCTGCGTCAAMCPNDAIELTIDDKKSIYIPKINEEKCNTCGICYKVCPGHEVDFKTLNLEIFGKESEDIIIGNYLNCYFGHATDLNIRYNSASGGLITQLLIFALEEGVIDGALVTRMKKDKPLEPEPFIARTREEIIEASRSKYCPVPVNVVLKEILNSKNGEKFAVVGLPCHLHGIRKAELMNKKLKEKIVLHVGIFCGHTPNFGATKFMLQMMNIDEKQVKAISYRGDGWPGGVSISLRKGSMLFVPHSHLYAWGGVFDSVFFTPHRCLLCVDGTSELADISFGDAWLPELTKDEVAGKSMIISRNVIGEEILDGMLRDGLIDLTLTSKEKVILSQWNMLNFKKKNIEARICVFNFLRREIPSFDISISSDLNCMTLLCAFIFCIHNLLPHRIISALKKISPKIFIKYSSLIGKVGCR